jgi:LysR family transcriptional regulator (chromosome initiation inhibitor)
MVPSSTDFVRAIALGLGWGMVADLQRADVPELVELEPRAARDVGLYLQRWRLRTASLDRLTEAIVAGARERLAQ